jgi:apolipoprotein N-acyltransferase
MLGRTRAAPTYAGTTARGTAWPMLFAALAGGVSLFSFSPFNWWPLQFAALAFLFYQVGMDTSVRRSTLVGWAFGFGWSIASMHWLYITMNRFGNIPGLMAVAAVCLLGAYMGLFGALATGIATALRRRWSLPVTAFLLLVLPPLWGLAEWMRGWLITGFPWGAAGYAHTDSALTGYAPLVGVYGLGALAALCAGCLVLLTQRSRKLGLALLAVLLAGGYALGQIEWTRPHGQPISVRLLQGNVPQQQKFEAEHVLRALEMYRAMIMEQPADLIALPETAFAVLPQYLPPGYLPALKQFSAQTGSALMFGIAISDRPGDYTNSVAGFAPSGQQYRFDKHHLVPFGEFVPPGFRWFVDMLRIPLGDMTRGAEVQPPFAVKDQLVLPNVCYEDVFGEEIALQLRHMAQPATMLLNVSNLAWFGESVAIPQHLQISRMRAIETGRPMLRATNTGATALIDGRGKLVSQVPNYRHGTLAARVQGMEGLTPYIRFGNYLFLALVVASLGAAWLWGRRFRESAKK